MRTTMTLLAAAVVALSLGSCKKKQNTGDIITQKVVKARPSAPKRMQGYTQRKDIDWGGSRLQVVITREPDDSLPMVKDETGQKHVDNHINVKITRPDGSVFFSKTFTKATFDSYLTENYRKNGVLEGLVFDSLDGQHMKLATSVSLPESDECIPLVVELSRMGVMSVARDTQMDTNGGEQDEE